MPGSEWGAAAPLRARTALREKLSVKTSAGNTSGSMKALASRLFFSGCSVMRRIARARRESCRIEAREQMRGELGGLGEAAGGFGAFDAAGRIRAGASVITGQQRIAQRDG